MTVIDFIDLSDHDIIDLSSDDETVQEDQIATQHRATSLDRQTMLVVAGEGSQDVLAAFVAASDGSQDVQTEFAAASEGRQEAAECGCALEAITSPLVMEKAPLVAASEGRQDVQAVFVAAGEGRQDVQAAEPKLECHNGPVEELPAEALTSEGGDEELVRGKVKHPRKNYHTGTPRTSSRFEPKRVCRNGPVEELPAEALISEGGDAELVRGKLKHPRKNYHAGTPRTSPRFEPKRECHNRPVEELPSMALTSEGGDAELVRGKLKYPRKNYHAGTPRTSPRFEPKRECHNGSVEELPAEVLTSEGGDAEMVRGEVKHSRKNYHTGTPRTSPRFEPKRECRNGLVEELPAEALTSDGADAELVRRKVKHARKDYHTDTPRTSPRFEQKLECRNRPVEELPAESLTSEGADAELVRGKVKHPRKDYHTGIPRRSPRFEPKRARRIGPMEELAADHKRFRTLEELLASPDNRRPPLLTM